MQSGPDALAAPHRPNTSYTHSRYTHSPNSLVTAHAAGVSNVMVSARCPFFFLPLT